MSSNRATPPDFEQTEETRIRRHPVVVYFTPTCGFCHAALALLADEGAEPVRVDVSSSLPHRAWLARRTGRHTVPQVFLGGDPVGGYTELLALRRSGELGRRLADSVEP